MSTLTAAPTATPAPIRLPVEPLEAAIRSHGGTVNVGISRMNNTRDTAMERHARAWYRARKRGWITIWAADDLCVQLLSLHPSIVYGDIWWDTLTQIDAHYGLDEDLTADVA